MTLTTLRIGFVRWLPRVSTDDFTKRQLIARLGIYKFKNREDLANCRKDTIVEIIELIETTSTREILDTE